MSTQTAASVSEGSGAMFDGIAPRYDAVNRVLSMGLDQRWRKLCIDALEVEPQHQILDLATGTGDLALAAARRAPGVHVVGLDPAARMMEIGRKKADAQGLGERIRFVTGDAQQLPFEASAFDRVCMGFGIRNVPDRARALSEMFRVLKPGGRLVILELSEPRAGLLSGLARLHVHVLVPWLGALLSGAREYRYLQRSIAAFPPATEFGESIRQAGFQLERIAPLTLGVAHLYVAVRGS